MRKKTAADEMHVFENSGGAPSKRRSTRLLKTRQPSTYRDQDVDLDELEDRTGKRRRSESDVSDSDTDYKPVGAVTSNESESAQSVSDVEVPAKKKKQSDRIFHDDIWDSSCQRKPFKLEKLAINLSEEESSSSDDGDLEFLDRSVRKKRATQGVAHSDSESSSQSNMIIPAANQQVDNQQKHDSASDITDSTAMKIFSKNLDAISKIQKAHDNLHLKTDTETSKEDCLQDVIADMLRNNEHEDCDERNEKKGSRHKKGKLATKPKKPVKRPTADSPNGASEERSKTNLRSKKEVCQESRRKKKAETKQSIAQPKSSGAGKKQCETPRESSKIEPKMSCSARKKQGAANHYRKSKTEETKEQRLQESDTSEDDDLSGSSDWEEVTASTSAADLDNYNPVIPSEGVEITLQAPLLLRKRKKHKFDPEEHMRLRINRRLKAIQECKHKVHLLCLLAWGQRVNNVLLAQELHATTLSLLPQEFDSYGNKKTTYVEVERLLKLFRRIFSYKMSSESSTKDISKVLTASLSSKFTTCIRDYTLLFLLILRSLRLEGRLCVSLYPIALKRDDLLKPKPKPKETQSDSEAVDVKVEDVEDSSSSKKSKKQHTKKKRSKKSGADENYSDDEPEKDKKSRSRCLKMSAKSEDKKKSGAPKPKGTKSKAKSGGEKKESTTEDSQPSGDTTKSESQALIEHWVEVFCNKDSRWVPVDVVHGSIGTIVESTIRDPILYVLGFDHDNCVKDITRKYTSEWLTTVPKQRVNQKWWAETLEPYRPLNREKDLAEDRLIETKLQKLPLPCSIAEFKNHPLYALKRHLLKFQAIYPSNAPTLGFVKGEPVYARECVHTLHSREKWLREARMVRVNEKPYKVVKARPKYDKLSRVIVTDQPLELFGRWQTEEYMPPIAFNGKVPRNAYGNVELFKPCMLPIGTVHLQVPGLCRVASKLGIDCAPAVVGFEAHHRGSHPVYDGWIVCEEFRDTLMEAWAEEQNNIEKRQAEKREKRIYGNWKRLIKAVLIRERLRAKYLDDD